MKKFARRLLPDLLIWLVLFILPLLFFFPVTLGGKTLIPADNLYQYEPWITYRAEQGVPDVPHNHLLSDLVLQNYQWKVFLRDSIETGDIPLWQPHQFAGTPFLANGQHSALYPFSLIYYVLPLESAFGWFTVSQLWLAGVLMSIYMRGIGLGRAAGLIAGVSYQLSSFFIVATVHPMIQAAAAWLPLILLMVEYCIQQRPVVAGAKHHLLSFVPWAVIGGGALGMSFLGGHIEITYYTLLISAIYAALRLGWELCQNFNLRAVTAPIPLLILLIVLGFAIGAVQFIPLIETANHSFRTERSTLEEVRGYALPPRHIALWLLPNIYGNPAHHSYQDVFRGETVIQDWVRSDNTRVTHTEFGIKNYVEGGAYVGILTLALAAYGFLFYKTPYRWILLIIGVIAVLFAFGTPFYAILYYLFPGLKQLHTPFRWIWAITFVLCVFAGFGAEALLQKRPSAKGFAALLLGLGALMLLALVGSRLFYDADLVERIYNNLSGATLAFPNAKAFYSYQLRNGFILTLALIGAGIVFSLYQRPKIWLPLAVGIIALDLFAATGNFNPAADPEWLDFTPPSIAWLQERAEEPFRIQGTDFFRIQTFDWGESILNANSGWRYGIQDVRGYDSLFSKQYADYMNQITPQGGLAFNRIDPVLYNNPQALLNKRYDLLNVRYFVTDWIIRPQEEFGAADLRDVQLQMVYEDASVRIYENLDAFPRAYLVPGEAEPQIETISQDQIAPVTITDYANRTVMIDATPEQNSWLVLADSYAPGWRAFIRPVGTSEDDEKEIPVTRVMENFRGVELEPGEWTIRFRYSPQSFQLGAFTSFISMMLVIFLLLVWAWNTFLSESADADSARRIVKNSLAPIILNLFNRGIDFAFAFIMLRILSPEGAGLYYYAIVVFGWFDILTNFGLNTLLTREVSRDRSQAWNYLLNTSGLRLGLAALGLPMLAIFLLIRNATISPALDTTALTAIFLLYIGLIPNSISTGLSALFYAFEKAEYPAALATVSTLVKVSLGLGALLMGWGVVGLAGASIITNFVTLLLMSRLAQSLIRSTLSAARLSTAMMRGMMSESWALMLNHLLATIFFKSDVILMEAINGVVIVGMYSTAYKWLDALNIIPAFFTMALLPIMSRQAQEDKPGLKRNYVFGFKALLMVALPVAIVTTFIAPTLIGILGGAEYLPEGGIALQIMIWSILVGWINSLTQYVLIALNRQRQITFAFIAAVSFNIIANLILMPQYSYKAAAVTTIFSELVLLVGFYRLLLPDLGAINFVQALWRPAAAAAIMLVGMLLLWNIHSLLAVLAGVILYPLVLGLLKPLTAEEGERLERVLPARWRGLLVR